MKIEVVVIGLLLAYALFSGKKTDTVTAEPARRFQPHLVVTPKIFGEEPQEDNQSEAKDASEVPSLPSEGVTAPSESPPHGAVSYTEPVLPTVVPPVYYVPQRQTTYGTYYSNCSGGNCQPQSYQTHGNPTQRRGIFGRR